MTTTTPSRRESRSHLTWANPALLAGRSMLQIGFFYALIVAGAATDTVAFKSVLDLVLQESQVISWLLAIGITFVALAFAWTIGRQYAHYKHEPDASLTPVLLCAVVWAGLGCAMAYIRAHATQGGVGSSDFGSAPDTHLQYGTAFLFAMLYFASGTVAIFEAYHTTNPIFSAYTRVTEQRDALRKLVAHLTGQAERARLVVAHHSGEFDRDLERRDEAIGGYQALGAELKHYSRVLIATLKQNARVTDLTTLGPKALDDPYPFADGSLPTSAEPGRSAVPAPADGLPAASGQGEVAEGRESA